MNVSKFIFLLFLLSTSLFSWTDNYGTDAPTNSSVELDLDGTFHLLYGGQGASVIGDIAATGDSILTTTDNNTYNAFITSKYTLSDTAFNTHTDHRKRNSSEATLNLPSYVEGKHITFAGLFWQGGLHENIGAGLTTAQVNTAVAGWNQVTLKTPDGDYHSLSASLVTKDTTNKVYHYAYKDDNSYHWNYSAYVDVTDLVKNTYSDTNNTFTVGNILTTTGKDFGDKIYYNHEPDTDGLWPSSDILMGYYGGWSLIVVYNLDQEAAIAHPEEKLKTVSIYDGYENYAIWVTPDPLLVSITIDNFLTPKSGTLNSKLLIFGGEADYGITGDVLEIYNPKTSSYDVISNALNPIGGQFNSSYTNLGTAMSPKTFRNGVDLDVFDVSSSMDYEQTSTSINFGVKQLGGFADQIYPQVLAFSTQLYEPQFCYDYAYKQQGIYFTEDNNGTQDPKITTNKLPNGVITGEPVEVSIFLRNLVDSDIEITDMNISVLDINTTQSTYERETTKLAKIGQLTPTTIADSSLVVDDAFIKNVQIGSMSSNENFFLYYSVDPKIKDLDTPITVQANYNLVVNAGTTIPYTLNIGANVPMCSAGNFNYAPSKGIFNVVHNNYYDLDSGGSKQFYNLPTQVTSREGNFKVISLDVNNTDQLSGKSTVVTVEMIDASAFHDTNTSCQEVSSSISEKVLVMFEHNATSVPFNQTAIQNAITDGMTHLVSSTDFYQSARQNTAFRVSYNLTNDGLDDLVDIKDGSKPNTYKINFTELVQNLGECNKDMDGIPNNTDTVAQWCSNNSDKLTKADIATCMECVNGFNTRFVCSRDNFSIKPEAFMLHLDDQNQTNPTSQSRITTNMSGVNGAIASKLNLASDYNYNIEANATNHLSNKSSSGYTKSFFAGNSEDSAQYTWSPIGTTVNACNDENNKSLAIRFVNGTVDANTSVPQVGDYLLNITDKTWTAVDSNSTYMGHHANSFFFPGDGSISLDCANNSDTQSLNSATLNGCDISSDHTNNEASLKYNDYAVELHPFAFAVTNSTKIGMDNIAPAALKPFVYMADISQDENMSVHLNTVITARGRNSATGLSNFVKGCYAQPLDINISKSPTINTQLQYKYRFHDINSTGSVITANDINGSIAKGNLTASPSLTTTNGYFQKDMTGSINTRANLNFHRDANATANPEKITFITYKIGDPNNTFNADLNTLKTAEGNVSIDQNITHFYGRTAGKTARIICDTTDASNICASGNDEDDVFIYYEVFCNGADCNATLLPTDVNGNPVQKVDSRWYINVEHNTTTYGAFTATVDSINNSYVGLPNGITHSNNYTLDSVHTYDETLGLPYTANMNDTVPRWLIYDPNNAAAAVNTHTVIFRPRTEWSGEHETNTTTTTKRIKRVNRRTMW